jgi:hypothetical protein
VTINVKILLIAGLLGLGTLANAANLFIDFTQTPTAFNQDANWDTFSATATSFTGTFGSIVANTGTETIAIIDQNTSMLLDTLTLTFSSGGFDGQPAEETFSGSVVVGGGPIPVGAIQELATGSSVDFTVDLANAGPFPSNITIEELQNSSAVPEPGSVALLGIGLACAFAGRRFIK